MLNSFINNTFLEKTKLQDDFSNYYISNNFREICDSFNLFLNSENIYFILQGFIGSGKTLFVKKMKDTVQKNFICIEYEFNSFSSLNDILLSFNTQLVSYAIKETNKKLKISTKDFSERICFLIKFLNKPIVVFFDAFENIENNDKSRNIIEFIKHLSDIASTKIVLTGRSISKSVFETDKIEKHTINPLDENEVRSLLIFNNKKLSDKTFSEFYKITKGYYLYCNLFCKLSDIFNIKIENLIQEFNKKNQEIDDFLFQRFLTLVPQNYTELLWNCCICQSFLNEKMLKNMNLIKKDEISYLEKINLLYRNRNYFYLKDYFKNLIQQQISKYLELKVHKSLKNYYTSQLPLKPSQRDLSISRETLKILINYHSRFEVEISSMPVVKKEQKTSEYNSQNETEKSEKIKIEYQPNKEYKKYSNKNNYISNIEVDEVKLTDEEIALLKENFTQNNDEILSTTNTYPEEKQVISDVSKSSELEKEYYLMAEEATEFNKRGDTQRALDLYSKIAKYYKQTNSLIKYAYTIYEIALIYKESYKFQDAEKFYFELENLDCKLPNNILAKLNLDMAEIEDINCHNADKAYECYKKAIAYAKNNEPDSLLAEIYFKYALWHDDKGDTQSALKNYFASTMACFDINKNKFLSSAFTNIAIIYQEQSNFKEALEYYHKAADIDNKTNNQEGLYFIYTNLASLYQDIDPSKIVTFYKKALYVAVILKDNLYLSSSLLNIGDYYYQNNNNEKALLYYYRVMKYTERLKSKENVEIIKLRIKDIQLRMGNKKFQIISDKIKNNEKDTD